MEQDLCQEHSQHSWRLNNLENRVDKMEKKINYILATCVTILSTLVIELVVMLV